MNLYNISKEMMDFLNNMPEDPTDEELAEIQNNYLQMNKAFEEKVEDTVKYMMELNYYVDSVKSEIERLNKLIKPISNKIDRLKNYISVSMDIAGHEKLQTSMAKISFINSESVHIIDQYKIPAEFMKTKTEISPNKVAIKKAIKKGQKIEGAEIQKNRNLQIK